MALMPGEVRRLAAVASIALALACDGRHRTNPLDPLNPSTEGRPDVLRAVADNEAVDLYWSAVPPDGFSRYEISRSDGGAPFELVRTVEEVGEVAYRDTGLINERTQRYRLDVVLEDGERVSLPEKEATPGAAVPWILENAPFGAVRLSPDARNLRARAGRFGVFFDLAVDGPGIWAADYFDDSLVRMDADGHPLIVIEVSLPYRIAVDRGRQRAWVASWRTDRDPVLLALAFDGRELARYAIDGEARDVAVDTVTGACYLALGRPGGIARAAIGDTLRVFGTSGSFTMMAPLDGRRLVGGDPFARRLYAFDLDLLAETQRVDLPDALYAIAADGNDVWTAEAPARLVRRDGDLTEIGSLPGTGGPTAIAIDRATGALWLALPSEGKVVRVSGTAEPSVSFQLTEPFQVAIGTFD